jgi:hypothetical protein
VWRIHRAGLLRLPAKSAIGISCCSPKETHFHHKPALRECGYIL